MSEIAKKQLPDFIIVGSMKSATTTIYEQLKALDGVFMPELKEPNFFSDQHRYDLGLDWYHSLFFDAKEGDIIGEASTHYTKLPTYKDTAERIFRTIPNAKIIYIMRDPVDRLVSQYIHEWTCKKISCDIDDAVEKHPELIEYSCYFYQIQPYIERFGIENVLPVFFERIKNEPESELKRISQFIGYKGAVHWNDSSAKTNVSSERLRLPLVMDFLVNSKFLSAIRRRIIPARIRDLVKANYRMTKRPEIGINAKRKVTKKINEDFENLGKLLDTNISVENYKSIVLNAELSWISNKEKAREALLDGG